MKLFFSSLLEDSVNSIHQKANDFSFNSEELNKSFDCLVEHKSSNNVDDYMHTAHQIITPFFEEILLFLRDRYNTFNLKISNDEIFLNINLKNSLFQNIKNKKMFSFKSTYKDSSKNYKKIQPSCLNMNDFNYANVLNVLERIHLTTLLKQIYILANYYNENTTLSRVSINNFMQESKGILNLSYKEVKNKYQDKIKNIEI